MLRHHFKHTLAVASAHAEVERVDAATAVQAASLEAALKSGEPDGLDAETRRLVADLMASAFPTAEDGLGRLRRRSEGVDRPSGGTPAGGGSRRLATRVCRHLGPGAVGILVRPSARLARVRVRGMRPS
jgi:hypothetical protein